MFHGLLLVVGKCQCFDDAWVSLYQFACSKAYGYACTLGVIFCQVHDGMHASVHGSIVCFGAAEVFVQGTFSVFSYMDSMSHQLVYAFVFHRTYGYHGYAQYLLHLVDAERTTVALYFVHHVKCKYHGNVQLHQLHCQVQTAFDT